MAADALATEEAIRLSKTTEEKEARAQRELDKLQKKSKREKERRKKYCAG